MTVKNSNQNENKVFIFPTNSAQINNKNEDDDHFKETFNTIHSIV